MVMRVHTLLGRFQQGFQQTEGSQIGAVWLQKGNGRRGLLTLNGFLLRWTIKHWASTPLCSFNSMVTCESPSELTPRSTPLPSLELSGTSGQCFLDTPEIAPCPIDKVKDPEKGQPAHTPGALNDASPVSQGDDALNIVSDTIRYVTPEEDKRVLRKIDRQ